MNANIQVEIVSYRSPRLLRANGPILVDESEDSALSRIKVLAGIREVEVVYKVPATNKYTQDAYYTIYRIP